MTATVVNYYSEDATLIVRAKTYRTRALAWRAIKRAQRRGQIALFAA